MVVWRTVLECLQLEGKPLLVGHLLGSRNQQIRSLSEEGGKRRGGERGRENHTWVPAGSSAFYMLEKHASWPHVHAGKVITTG